MRKKLLRHFIVIVSILVIGLSVSSGVQAGSKDLEASKRTVYQDNSTQSMRDVYARREVETKEYNQQMLSNSKESIELLKEIRNLLQQLNEKE